MSKMLMILLANQLILMKTQILMVVVIIVTCLMSSYHLYLNSMDHWMSILPILIYVSGIMVLFMFIVSLVPNEKTMVKPPKLKVLLISFIPIVMATKNLSFSEGLKINSMFKWNMMAIIMVMAIILIMAYIPPKIITSMNKGMKTSK